MGTCNVLRSASSKILISFIAASIIWIVAVFHPFYFGDELPAFVYSGKDAAFAKSFHLLNSYKPRLVFNALWAFIGDLCVPRVAMAGLVASLWAAVMALTYAIARCELGCQRGIALMAAALAGFSRFSVMLRYDYLAGTIELGAFVCFLIVLWIVLLASERIPKNKTLVVVGVAFAMATVFIHERYIAAFVILGAMLCIQLWVRRQFSWSLWCLALGISILPLLFFFIATKSLSSVDITTGTAGRKISIGFDTVKVFLSYIVNVLFGTNYGEPCFVGEKLPTVLAVGVVSASVVAWMWVIYTIVRSSIDIRKLALLGVALIALVGVASLPGPDRQEARWMFPVAVLAGLMVAALRAGSAAKLALGVALVTQAFYMMTGHLNEMCDITASRQARDIGNAVSHIALPGSEAVVFGVPEPDISWILRGGNIGSSWSLPAGELFARANRLSLRLVPPSAVGAADKPDFGLVRQDQGIPFRLIGRAQTFILLNPEEVSPEVGTTLGGGSSWEGWKWATQPSLVSGSIVLRPGFDGFVEIDAHRLDSRLLVYRAEALVDTAVPMRLQINWTKRDGTFLSATIRVVRVGRQAQNYVLPIVAPPGAEVGEVYVSLHDGASGAVIVQSVRLVE